MRYRLTAILLALGLVVGACSNTSNQDQVVLVVSAASSLTDAFTDIAAAFEAANPGIDIQLNLGSSSSLREQILAGAPADIFASADVVPMDLLVADGLVDEEPVIFATNSLAIAVPPDNPGAVTGLNDLADPELLIGLCAKEVPCGVYARQVLARAEIEASIDTNETDVRSLVSKIELGELDAGIVYKSDVAGGDLVGIDIPANINVTALYPIAVVSESLKSAPAMQFVAFVLSDDGQAHLRATGFGAP